MLEGSNLWLQVEGHAQRVGFFTTRYVEARDPEQARSLAVQRLLAEPKLSASLNPAGEQPRVESTEVHELESFEGIANLQPGLSFYLEETPTPS
jgi:hypothetical protein